MRNQTMCNNVCGTGTTRKDGEETMTRSKSLLGGTALAAFCLAAFLGAASASAQTVQQVCSSPGSGISDNSTTTDQIVIGAPTGAILDLDVFLDISHTWVGDLDITLDHTGPGTTRT